MSFCESCSALSTLLKNRSLKQLVAQARAAATASGVNSAAAAKVAEAAAQAVSGPNSTEGDVHADRPAAELEQHLCNGTNGIAHHATPVNGRASKAPRKVKWKKMAASHLHAMGSMKLKKLQKVLLSEAGCADLQDELMRTLSKSSQFKIDGKRIALASK